MAEGHRAFGAARRVLDSREHDGILAASGPPILSKPQLAAVYTRFLTAANNPARLTRLGESVTEVLEKIPARLKVIRETTDGFRIAEEDLKLRGEGDVLGVRQSGLPGYRIARPDVHAQLITQARDEALRIMKDNPKQKGERGEALRCLLYLFERDEAIPLIGAG